MMELNFNFEEKTNPEKILTLVKGLNCKNINPDDLLFYSVKHAKNKEDLIPIGLALRYGANPNLYKIIPCLGNIHILGFLYKKFKCLEDLNQNIDPDCKTDKNEKLLNSIVMMLKVSGSDPSLPVFFMPNEKSLFKKKKDVTTWLCENCYENILDSINDKLDNVKPESKTVIGVFLDKEDMIKTEPNWKDVISSHSCSILTKGLNKIDSGLKLSIDYLNLYAFRQFIKSGQMLDYLSIYKILIRIKNCDALASAELFNMLLYAVDRGCLIDIYQMKYLEEINCEFASLLTERYERPFWRKNCKVTKGNVSIEMKKLAYSLNLNPEMSKEGICCMFSRISEANLEDVKIAVVKRQEQRIASTLADHLEYIDDEDKQNFTTLRNDNDLLYDLPDNDICFYKDVEGVKWGFTRESFFELLEEKRNPYTNLPLPQLLIDEMEKRTEYAKNLTLDTIDVNLVPISEILSSLNCPDLIGKNTSVDKFINLGIVNGVDLQSLSREKMEKILEEDNEKEINLCSLSNDAMFNLFAVVSYSNLIGDELKTTEFFLNLKESM